MLFRVIGWLLTIEAIIMVIPLIAGLVFGEHESLAFVISMTITGTAGVIMMSLRPKLRDMGSRDAILLTALIWVILSLFGMLPFLLCKTHLNITDAFFETMSGFTTTGASVLNSLEGVPKSILLWRCVVQWIGGLGIILFTIAVVPMLNYSGGIMLFNAEVTGITHEKLRPRISNTAKGLWLVYICLTVLLIILLTFSEMSPFEAICHGLSSISTGGYSTNDMSIHAWDSDYVKIVIMIFMFLGGVNFSLLYHFATTGNWRVWNNTAFKYYCGFTLVCYILLCLTLWDQDAIHSVRELTIDPLFQTISILSSTGLVAPGFYDWGPLSEIVLVVMMFVGACAGSTSGGAKIDRIVIMWRFIKNEFYKIIYPNAVTTVVINGKGTPYQVVQKVLAFLFIYIMVILVAGCLLVIMGLPLHDSLFCALSAISNTGFGTSNTGFSGNYALVPAAGKWLLAFVMLIGRLELYSVLIIFTRSFWRK